MTTEAKAVARFDRVGRFRHMSEAQFGEYIRFTDHERVVGELRTHVERLRDAMFAVYSVAANGGSLSRLHTEIERMRDAMEKQA